MTGDIVVQQETSTAGCNLQEQQLLAPGADVQQGTDAVSGSSSSSSRSQMLVNQLMSAVEAGDSSKVQQLLDNAKVDMTDRQLAEALCRAAASGRSALHQAAAGGHIDTVQVLLKAGADVGARADDGTTPLYHAAVQGHLLVVHELLAAGAGCDDGRAGGSTPLRAAAAKGHLSVVKALLAAGADVNATAGGFFHFTALSDAAQGGHADVVRELLAAGAVGNVNGCSALARAARQGHVKVVQVLLSRAAVCSKQQWICAAEQAVCCGQLGVLNALLAAPAELQERNCLLVKACEFGHTCMVEHLLGIGLKSSLHSPGRCSALAAATVVGHVDAVVLLLRASKEQAPTHAQVFTAVHMAVRHRSHRVLAQLLLHLHKSGDKRVHDAVSALEDPIDARMALLRGWAADAAQRQQQQALVALEQDMAGSRPVVMGLLFAVQHPAVRVAAAQEAALP